MLQLKENKKAYFLLQIIKIKIQIQNFQCMKVEKKIFVPLSIFIIFVNTIKKINF